MLFFFFLFGGFDPGRGCVDGQSRPGTQRLVFLVPGGQRASRCVCLHSSCAASVLRSYKSARASRDSDLATNCTFHDSIGCRGSSLGATLRRGTKKRKTRYENEPLPPSITTRRCTDNTVRRSHCYTPRKNIDFSLPSQPFTVWATSVSVYDDIILVTRYQPRVRVCTDQRSATGSNPMQLN